LLLDGRVHLYVKLHVHGSINFCPRPHAVVSPHLANPELDQAKLQTVFYPCSAWLSHNKKVLS